MAIIISEPFSITTYMNTLGPNWGNGGGNSAGISFESWEWINSGDGTLLVILGIFWMYGLAAKSTIISATSSGGAVTVTTDLTVLNNPAGVIDPSNGMSLPIDFFVPQLTEGSLVIQGGLTYFTYNQSGIYGIYPIA